MNSTFTSNF